MTETTPFDALIIRADALGCDDLVRILQRMNTSVCAGCLDGLREALDDAERLRVGENLVGTQVPILSDALRTGLDTLRRLQQQRLEAT